MEPKDFIVFVCLVLFAIVDLTETSIPKYYIDEHCDQMLNLNYGGVEVVRLHLTRSEKYPDGMRCRMIIQAPEGKRLMMVIEKLDLDANSELQNNQNTNTGSQMMTQGCGNGDYAVFIDGSAENGMPLLGLSGRVCHRPEQKSFTSSGRYISLFFTSNTNMLSGRGMTLLFTAFNDGPCEDSQFKCTASGICIKKSLECDGFSNCVDQSDEAMPRCMSTGVIAGIAVGGSIMIILIIIIIVICCTAYQRRKRARIIKRAMDRGDFPHISWDRNDVDVTFDPITEENLRSYSAIDADSELPDTIYELSIIDGVLLGSHKLKEEINESGTAKDEQNTDKPKEGSMIKYPSGFWDITITDLGREPVTDL